MPKVTISEVAVRAGVSRATADRVLNRRGGVSADKERAVLLIARTMGLDRNLERVPGQLLRVGVLMQPPQNPFYERLGRGFREANLLFDAQAITAYVSHIDVLAPDTIPAQIRRMAKTYDAVVIVAPERESTIEALEAIPDGIPVVTLASDLPLIRPRYYVGPRNDRAGRLAGELIGRLVGPQGGDVLFVNGLHDFSGHRERARGFREVLESDFPSCRICLEIDSLDHVGMVADRIAKALRRNPAIRGIYNISQGNDEIVRCVGEHGIAKDFVFVCHDLTPTSRALLTARAVDVVIDQDPMLEAQRAMEIILTHYGRLPGLPVDGSTPIRVFFRENLEDGIG